MDQTEPREDTNDVAGDCLASQRRIIMTQRIGVLAPVSTWSTDRYEELIFRIYHHYPEATILEQQSASDPVKGVATVIFIRDENRCISLDLWTTLTQAAASGKNVKLARMDRDGLLVLVGWKQLSFETQDDGRHFRVNYTKPAAAKKWEKREKVEAS
jgi:hypothetical protein